MYRFKPCTKCGAPALYNKDDEMTEVDRTPVKRVWGEYSTIAEYDGIKIKELRVSPGGTLSFQRHEKREEHWKVVKGKGIVITSDCPGDGDNRVHFLNTGEELYIDQNVWHQLTNPYNEFLVIVETQKGEECTEEDIERLT